MRGAPERPGGDDGGGGWDGGDGLVAGSRARSTGGSGGGFEASAWGRTGSAGDGAGSGPTGSSIVAADYQTWTRRPSLAPHLNPPRRHRPRRDSAGG